jgi:hypothetical protein
MDSFPTQRGWKKVVGNIQDFQISLECRGEKNTLSIPEKLYSPIKYTLNQSIKNPYEKVSSWFFYAQLINSKTREEIFKNGKKILQTMEGKNPLVFNSASNSFCCSNKFQITDSTYHYGGAQFILQIFYFTSADLENPVEVLESPAFQVLARKPTDGKRKREATVVDEPVTKKSTLQKFRQLLDELVACKENLSNEDKIIANELTQKINDPTFDDLFADLEFTSLFD